MSRLDNPLSEIHAGTHLVVILEASVLRDSEKLPIIAKDGSNGIKIRFNDNKLNHDKVFWTKSSDFKKLCAATESDMKKAICPELRGKTLWMCVKEIRTMNEDKYIGSVYEPFDYLPYIPQMTKPIISGDPCQHPKGEPLGVFVEYVQYTKGIPVEERGTRTIESGGEYKVVAPIEVPLPTMKDVVNAYKHETIHTIGDRLAIGREIIAKGEANKDLTSLNEKNNPPKEEVAEKDVFEEEAPTEQPPVDDDELDWSKL